MGFIAAWSKAGAAIGTQVGHAQNLMHGTCTNPHQVFTAILASYSDTIKGNQVVFLIGSAFAVLGALNAWFVVQDGEKHLEKEDQIWKSYLLENGWDASWGDHQTQDPAGTLKDELKATS
jgi:hypothetical protein